MEINIKSKSWYLLTAALGSILMLSACSSDDAQKIVNTVIGDVTVSGQITSVANPSGEQGVSVKGIYGTVLGETSPETTDATGMYSLVVLKDTPVSLQASKAGFITLNSAKASLSADESNFDIELPLTSEAESAITAAGFGNGATLLPAYAWLAVNVVNGLDNEVAGIPISTTGTPVAAAATDCDGLDSGNVITIASCVTDRNGPMYLAYFDTESAEVTVTAGTDSQLAPVRRGQVTFLEFVQ